VGKVSVEVWGDQLYTLYTACSLPEKRRYLMQLSPEDNYTLTYVFRMVSANSTVVRITHDNL